METETSLARPLMSIEDAVARIERHLPIRDVQQVKLSEAIHRVLAQDVSAPFAVPSYDNSALDGYAFRFSDLPADGRMSVSGRIAAGHPLRGILQHGTAVRIFTGGAIPDGADTVAMQEDCLEKDGVVVLPRDIKLGANKRFAGEDVEQNTTILVRGVRLRPQDIGIAAALGQATLMVYRRLKVGVLATGDELRAPGEVLPTGCIYDTNRHTIAAALRDLGAEVTDYGLIPDQMSIIRDALTIAAGDNDLVISSGGVSVGEEDHVRPAVQEIGSLDFWKLALKPGKPAAMGEVAGVPFVGLPGNPVSAMVTFWLIARPLVLRLMGTTDITVRRFPVISTFRHRHNRGRREFLRVRVNADANGLMQAETHPSTSSGVLSSLVWSDGLLEIHEEVGDVNVGDILSYLPYCGFYG
jgi:molybdopterin molybdotransferase